MKTRLALLGSTGSIGRTCLNIAERERERYEVVALGAGTQWKLLARQVRNFRPTVVSLATEQAAESLRAELGDEAPDIRVGCDGLAAVATHADADIIVSGLTGGIGVEPTIAAVRAGKDVALANKEVIVIAGEIVSREAKRTGARLLPVDSEISAIWQCLQAGHGGEVRRVLLTASGGPFRELPVHEFREITPERALEHPTWVMGRKVTIDSATLMNKGFEILEVRWLFDIPLSKIEVLVHHQSIIHSLVEYTDGSLIAQLGVPDMTLPIHYALTHPNRMPSNVEPLDLAAIGSLTFERPDVERFPALDLARKATEIGGTMPAVLSGADEVAVEAFLDRRLPFVGIPALIEETMSHHSAVHEPTLEAALEAECWARLTAADLVERVAARASRTTVAAT